MPPKRLSPCGASLCCLMVLAVVLLPAHRSFAADRPNVVLILADDMGYSDIGCYGGEIETPSLDRLAAGGLRFTQFYNSGRCCPTRASLMTGLHPHQTGIGHMTNPPHQDRKRQHDRGVVGYRGFLNRENVTLAEALGQAGYHTLVTGKWHLGYHGQEKWPLQRRFDRFYGILSGACNYFDPRPPRGLTLDNEPVAPESTTDHRYYTTDAFTDYGIRFVKQALDADDRPFFLYLAYTAPHWPLHALKEDVAKYRGKYMVGWDEIRRRRYQRMREMGLLREQWKLTERDSPTWDELSPKKQDEMDHRMAIYAAQIDRMDHNIGRLVEALRQHGELENTLILFLSDNGGCQEGGMFGRGPLEREQLEKADAASYGQAWANASNTPYRLYKHYVHEGGAATPMIAHWPAGITPQAAGKFRRQPAYLPDVMPTLLELAKAEYPSEYDGRDVPPMEGVSMLPALLRDESLGRDKPMFWEHEGNRAIRIGQWKLVSAGDQRDYGGEDSWELYDLAEDRTETNDLRDKLPDRAERMRRRWWTWARSHRVVPNGKE